MWTTKEILPDLNQANTSYYNYFKLVNMWSKVFGPSAVNIRLFEQVCSKTTLIDDFLDLLPNIDRNAVRLPPNSNQSLSKQCRDILVWLNSEYPRPDAYRIAFKKFIIWELERERGKQSRALPSKFQAIQFCELFQESNERLSETYLSGNKLFDEDFEEYPDSQEEFLDTAVIREKVQELELIFPNRFFHILTRFDAITLVYLLNLLPQIARLKIRAF